MDQENRKGNMLPSCGICGQSFRRLWNLRRHEETHRRERERHRCPQCPAAFFRFEDLRKHTRRMHVAGSYQPETVTNRGKEPERRDKGDGRRPEEMRRASWGKEEGKLEEGKRGPRNRREKYADRRGEKEGGRPDERRRGPLEKKPRRDSRSDRESRPRRDEERKTEKGARDTKKEEEKKAEKGKGDTMEEKWEKEKMEKGKGDTMDEKGEKMETEKGEKMETETEEGETMEKAGEKMGEEGGMPEEAGESTEKKEETIGSGEPQIMEDAADELAEAYQATISLMGDEAEELLQTPTTPRAGGGKHLSMMERPASPTPSTGSSTSSASTTSSSSSSTASHSATDAKTTFTPIDLRDILRKRVSKVVEKRTVYEYQSGHKLRKEVVLREYHLKED